MEERWRGIIGKVRREAKQRKQRQNRARKVPKSIPINSGKRRRRRGSRQKKNLEEGRIVW